MENSINHHSLFLATTALESFWDTSKPILFLGEWCLLYGRRSFWKSIDGRILESPFKSSEVLHAAAQYVNEIYEHTLPLLGEALNSIHEKNFSVRYWRILLGPWLQTYLAVVYDRYTHLKCVLEQYPNCATIVLSEESYVVPSDTLDFECYLMEDSFNLQIYSKIFSVLGKTFPRKEAQIVQNPCYDKFLNHSWKNEIISYISRIYKDVLSGHARSIILRNSHFSKMAELIISIKNPGKVIPIWCQTTKQSFPECDNDTRNKLKKIRLGDSEFEQCLSAMLFPDMPKCFIEGFGALSSMTQKTYTKNVKAIFSSNGWYFDEIFKQWAAESAEQGTLLLGTQHGGNYGSLSYMTSENHETAIVDRYYSWGWTRSNCAAKVVPFTSSKLTRRKKEGANKLKTGVLWAATSSPRYLTQFPFVPNYFEDYLLWQCRFAKTLLPTVVTDLRFRPHYENFGWDTIKRLTDVIPNIRVETWVIPFQESLKKCRIYVCDHLSTTFTEALSINKPTILFWNPQSNILRSEAKFYYDLLRKKGILFDMPELAGAAVNAIYEDVETWWNEPERQSAVEVFCERYARTSPNAIQLWSNEFKKIADDGRIHL